MSAGEKAGVLKPHFVARYYRGIIVTLVMVNTVLIMFLIIYLWAFSPSMSYRGRAEPITAGVVLADRLIMWSEPGGLEQGAQSRGVAERGGAVDVLRAQRLDQELWLEVAVDGRQGWVPESGIDYGGNQAQ